MDTHLADWIRDTPDGKTAERILRSCVHCGFCTATCPTYQLLGDELDGPRGRIYLIKQVLEGHEVTRSTQEHLDRCLTCRNCETTCPSGVKYGQLIDIGRKVVEAKVKRPLAEKIQRSLLKTLISNRPLFETSIKLGRLFKPLVPAALQNKITSSRASGQWPTRAHQRKVILLKGCVQPGLLPSIDAATARVLDAFGVQSIVVESSGCCGAVKFHMNDHTGALAQMRRNIDAWWPLIESGQIEAIVMNASGCGVTVNEYGHYFEGDHLYSMKARRISELTQDLGTYFSALLKTATQNGLKKRLEQLQESIRNNQNQKTIAFHPPCTLQHGQQIKGVVEGILTQLGFELTAIRNSHLCCGSAGTYSILQASLSEQLKKQKITALEENKPHAIASANIGCLTHLESAASVPVRHWIELVDNAMR